MLAAVVAEVSALLNTRPLTYLVSVDPFDPDPLTPNHFLHESARPPQTPLKFVDVASTSATEKQFKYGQEVVEHFWRSWLREYIDSSSDETFSNLVD